MTKTETKVGMCWFCDKYLTEDKLHAIILADCNNKAFACNGCFDQLKKGGLKKDTKVYRYEPYTPYVPVYPYYEPYKYWYRYDYPYTTTTDYPNMTTITTFDISNDWSSSDITNIANDIQSSCNIEGCVVCSN